MHRARAYAKLTAIARMDSPFASPAQSSRIILSSVRAAHRGAPFARALPALPSPDPGSWPAQLREHAHHLKQRLPPGVVSTACWCRYRFTPAPGLAQEAHENLRERPSRSTDHAAIALEASAGGVQAEPIEGWAASSFGTTTPASSYTRDLPASVSTCLTNRGAVGRCFGRPLIRGGRGQRGEAWLSLMLLSRLQ
jgi:hypothetical protein